MKDNNNHIDMSILSCIKLMVYSGISCLVLMNLKTFARYPLLRRTLKYRLCTTIKFLYSDVEPCFSPCEGELNLRIFRLVRYNHSLWLLVWRYPVRIASPPPVMDFKLYSRLSFK